MEPFFNYISGNIKTLRKINAMTQGELAQLLNVENTAISNYESGYSTPGYFTVIKLAEIFKCSIDDLTSKIIKGFELRDSGNFYMSFMRNVPVYSSFTDVSGGDSVIVSYLSLPACKETEGVLAGIIMPDSSIDLTGTAEGDIIIFRHDVKAADGDIVLVFSDEDYYIGRFKDEGDLKISVSPESSQPGYDKKYFDLSDGKTRIAGVKFDYDYKQSNS